MLISDNLSAPIDHKKMPMALLVCSFWALASFLLFLKAIQHGDGMRTLLASIGMTISVLFVVGTLFQLFKAR